MVNKTIISGINKTIDNKTIINKTMVNKTIISGINKTIINKTIKK